MNTRLLIALIAFAPLLRAESLLNDLDKAQLYQVTRGTQVVTMESVEGKPWPRVKLYQRVRATPEEVAAVFFDYRNAKGYIPKVFKSDISRHISPCVLEVDYGIDVPLYLPDEFYTVRNSLTAGEDGSYCVTWILLRALQTKASEGNLRIECFHDGSVLCYTNFVTPSSAMAGLLKLFAIEQMRNTVQAIVHQVEKLKRENPEALKQEVLDLQEALRKETQR
ncbi:MAG: hypothetical protein WCQ16_12025 [Verrucomicrobiae bacterium]